MFKQFITLQDGTEVEAKDTRTLANGGVSYKDADGDRRRLSKDQWTGITVRES